MPNNDAAIFKLFQLISPSLPIGGFTYSQGIEWAVEEGWISDVNSLREWVEGLFQSSILYLELPLLKRFYKAWSQGDEEEIIYWNQFLLASRESYELRQEEINRARAMSDLLMTLDKSSIAFNEQLKKSQTACYAYACVSWQVGLNKACEGFVWAWLENIVLSAIKIIPLGQTQGQKVLLELAELIPAIISQALLIDDEDVGCSNQALSIASSQHETQYTRIFRS